MTDATISLVVSAFLLAATARTASAEHECVLDRKVHLYDTVLDVPDVPPLCDSLPVTPRRVDIGDCELYTEQEGDGMPLVLLHGGPGATHHVFHPYFSAAADFARVIYYDQRGCGQSDYEPGDGYSIPQAVDDLERLRQALGFEKWVVLGHSYGGTVAECYAVRYPDRVAGLVVVGASFHDPGPRGASRSYDYISREEEDRRNSFYADSSLSLVQQLYNAHRNGDWKRQNFYRPSDVQLARMARYEWVQDERFRPAISKTWGQIDLDGVFTECPLPTLVMEGRWDMSADTGKAERIHRYFGGSTLKVFERAGHSPFEDEPEAFFAELRRFMESLPAVPPDSIAAWREFIVTRQEANTARRRAAEEARSPTERLLRDSGWGRRSSERIAEAYSPDWLEEIDSARLLFRAGLALYDMERYEDAITVFDTMAEKAAGRDPLRIVAALIWKGHMLDLLDRHDEAVPLYEEVVRRGVHDNNSMSIYDLHFRSTEWAAERIVTPFTRIENRQDD